MLPARELNQAEMSTGNRPGGAGADGAFEPAEEFFIRNGEIMLQKKITRAGGSACNPLRIFCVRQLKKARTPGGGGEAPEHHEKNFVRNGETLLQKQISFAGGRACNPLRIFSAGELKRATRDYHPDLLIQDLGTYFYDVFRGTIDGDRPVAVNRLRQEVVVHDDEIEQVIKEIVILSSVNHRNVVRLLGCCLETRVPVLVLELASALTLQDFVVDGSGRETTPMPWRQRLLVAAGVAEGLDYLHSHASVPLINTRLEPASIMLDGRLAPKLTNFWHAVPIPAGKTNAESDHIEGFVYFLDPEYALTGVVTEKSDVYAAGVLMLVLITGRHPYGWLKDASFEFLTTALTEGRLATLLGGEGKAEELEALYGSCRARLVGAAVVAEGEVEGYQLQALVDLALRCVRHNREGRPDMREVVAELRRVGELGRH